MITDEYNLIGQLSHKPKEQGARSKRTRCCSIGDCTPRIRMTVRNTALASLPRSGVKTSG